VAGRDGLLMTGLLPDFDKMMDACFDVLAEFNDESGVSRTDIYMLMNFIPGGTLKTLTKDVQRKGQAGARELDTGYDIASLSEAVHYQS